MENTTTTSTKKVVEADVKKPRLTAAEFTKEFKRQWVLVAISVAYVIYGIIFYYLPLVGWIMAFQNFVYADGKFLFSDKTFLMVIRNTFAMGVLNLVFSTVFAIGFAILLNEVRTKWFKKTIQTISYMPHFLSWIIVVAIVHDALTSTGVINEILMSLKIVEKPYPFLQIEGWFWPIVTFSHLWKETGWNAIIYLAAITSIDPCLYESASIDGAGRFQKIKYVTLPGIRPTIMILLLMNLGNVLNAGFEIQYLLGNDLVRDVSRTIDIYILDWALDIVVSNYIAKKRGDERLF